MFPDRKNESYRYTSFTKLGELKLVPSRPAATPPALLSVFDEADDLRLVFINGRLTCELSSDLSRGGIAVETFNDDKPANPDPLVRFNAAQSPEGWALRVPANASIPKTLKLFFWHLAEKTEPGTKVLLSPRLRLTLEPNASLNVEECHLAQDGAENLENGVLEVRIGENARLNHHGVFLSAPGATVVNSILAELGANASLTAQNFTLGSGLERHNLSVRLNGAGADCRLYGLYAVGAGRHADHHTVVEHAVPGTSSEQVYKGIVAEGGKTAFGGKVMIAKDAQRSKASQLNRNVILGPGAEANSAPELEIAADDVKCNHGATVGQLGESEVFYLESRGIPRAQAKAMLLKGFAEDVLVKTSSAFLRGRLSSVLNDGFFKEGI